MLRKSDAEIINTRVLIEQENWPRRAVTAFEEWLQENGYEVTLGRQVFCTTARAVQWLWIQHRDQERRDQYDGD